MQIPFLRPLLELPLLSSVIQGFLPSLVLLTFLAVLPYTLAALISRGGLHSLTAEDSLLTLMYFLFQLFAVSTVGSCALHVLLHHLPCSASGSYVGATGRMTGTWKA